MGIAEQESFKLGAPALVCRWRLSSGRLPLENRHLRAFSQRRLGGRVLTSQLVAWAKQHIEWTLDPGSAQEPDGVLMVIVDEGGRAAMTVGPYEPLEATGVIPLATRARASRREAECTGVAPETLWAFCSGRLVAGVGQNERLSGAASLVWDLAVTLGLPVVCEQDLVGQVLASGGLRPDEAFLVSDEHGVVASEDLGGSRARRFSDAYHRLLAAADRR